MKSDEFNRVDQAVFGYSNGHRELASSISLSPVDTYELAAASDLAPGVQLDSHQSYLTGLTLPESKKYALIRTWLAPEMPRPGCVWSHVLILDRQVLSTQADLTVLNRMFRRPAEYQQDASLSISVSVSRRAKGLSAREAVIEQVLAACYSAVRLNPDASSDHERENAILAVWSQQWPRLRTTFVFRSMFSSTDLKGQAFLFQTSTPKSPRLVENRWIEAAAIDATSESITPLRRFLWRYGKDIDANRRSFPVLVTTYLDTRGANLDPEVVANVFEQFQAGQADTLKRDLLGLSQSKLSLVPALTTVDLITLIANLKSEVLGSTEDEIVGLFTAIRPMELPETVREINLFREKLGPLVEKFQNALIPLATEECLVHPDISHWFLSESLFRREELITERTASLLFQDELVGLARTDIGPDKTKLVLGLLLQRDCSREAEQLLDLHAGTMFDHSVKLHQAANLPKSWVDAFRRNPLRFIPFIEDLETGDILACAADLLGYPIGTDADVVLWHSQLRATWSTANATSQGILVVYIFALCVRAGLADNRRVLRDLLPELRKRILKNSLPSSAKNMLDRWLPEHRDSWDLNRRLLKLFRRDFKRGIDLTDILDVVDLTDEEYAYATNQDPDNLVRSVFRAMMPWIPWD